MSTTLTATEPSQLKPSNPSTIHLIARPSHERGRADLGWLKTFHTFSFAKFVTRPSLSFSKGHFANMKVIYRCSYFDAEMMGFGSLRVINEDRVEPAKGFGVHSHREMEIFSYIVSGELEHRDSMGNLEIIKRGDVQVSPKFILCVITCLTKP